MSVASGEYREAAALDQNSVQEPKVNSAKQDETVPLHAMMAMREEFQAKLKAEQEKNEAFRNHIQMSQWKQAQAPAKAPDPFANVDPEESIKVKDAMRLMGDFERRQEAQMAELKFASRTPDYRDVIQKFLPKAAQEDPDLLEEINRSPNPYKTAYLAAKASSAYQDEYVAQKTKDFRPPAQEKPRVDPEAEKMVANAKQSGNLASVGSQSSVAGKHPNYRDMSDDDFKKLKHQNLFRSRPK